MKNICSCFSTNYFSPIFHPIFTTVFTTVFTSVFTTPFPSTSASTFSPILPSIMHVVEGDDEFCTHWRKEPCAGTDVEYSSPDVGLNKRAWGAVRARKTLLDHARTIRRVAVLALLSFLRRVYVIRKS